MFILGIVLFFVVMIGLMVLSVGATAFIDFPSLVVILGLTMPVILASGLWKDLINGFKVMTVQVNPFTVIELKRILVAVRLTQKMLLLSGVLGTMAGTVGILSSITEPSQFGPFMAVAVLTLFYALLLIVVFMAIEARTKAMIAALE